MADERVTVKNDFGHDVTGKVKERDYSGKPTKIETDFGTTYTKSTFSETFRQEK
ncbi:MAG: hypothetical protein K9I84_05620 [Leadbetterella sp.]|nr:hypothetical protein [Leadbetterella sp.]